MAAPAHNANTVATVVQPVPFSGQRDLENELNSMLAIYQEKEGEANWMKREKALQRMRGLLVSGAASDPYFVNIVFKKVAPPTTESMLSLRTQLSLQACLFVSDLARHLRNDFSSQIETFVSVIIKLFAQTKKIVANAGSEAMDAIIESLESPKIVNLICPILADKNKDVRIKGSESLKKMLELWGEESFLKNEAAVEKSLKQALVDATPAVRENARVAFWCYVKNFPSRATPLLESFDSTTRKNLVKSKPKDITLALGDLLTPSTETPTQASSSSSSLNKFKGAFQDLKEKEKLEKEGSSDNLENGLGRSKSASTFEITFADEKASNGTIPKEEPSSSFEISVGSSDSKLTVENRSSSKGKQKDALTLEIHKEPLSSPSLTKATPSTSFVSVTPAEPDSSLSSSWQKAEVDEEWVEVDFDKEKEKVKMREPQGPTTPKRSSRPVPESLQSIVQPSTPTSATQQEFLSPSILRDRDSPRTPSSSSPHYNWEKALPVLLHQIESGEVKDDTFLKLCRLSRNQLSHIWDGNFQTILKSSHAFYDRPQTTSRQKEQCLQLLKEMIVHQKDYFQGKVGEVLQFMVTAKLTSTEPANQYLVQQAIEQGVSKLSLEEVYSFLWNGISKENDQEEKGVLFSYFPKAISRFAEENKLFSDELLSSMARLILKDLQNDSVHIRQHAMSSLVEIRLSIPESRFTSQFGNNMTSQQKKLLEMCFRKHSAVAKRHGGQEED